MASGLTENKNNNGGNLSQSDKITVPLSGAESNIELDQVPKLSTDITMKDGDELDRFVRPRSFSDTSSSTGDHTYLKALRDKILGQKNNPELQPNKTSMKVIVRRETEPITQGALSPTPNDGRPSMDRGRVRDGNANRSNMGSGDYRLDRARSTGVLYEQEDSIPPPKPELPKGYKLYTLQSHSLDYDAGHARPSERNVYNQLDRTISDIDNNEGNNGAISKRKPTESGIPRDRHSRSDGSARRSSLVFRHSDARFQTELLQKELSHLRSEEHVRKQSKAVKQLLTENQPNTMTRTGNRVRFSGDFTESGTGTKTQTDLNTNGAKKILRQSKSVDIPRSGPNMSTNTGTMSVYNRRPPDNSTHFGTGPSQSYALRGMVYSNRQTSKHVDASGSVYSDEQTTKHLAQLLKDDLDGELLEPRRGLNLHRGQGQTRSKSESVINRNSMQRSKSSVGDYASLSTDQRIAQMSRSTSNLRRKCDTITRFNHSEMEKKRERVRANFELKKADEHINVDEGSFDMTKQAKLKSRFETIRKFNKEEAEQKRERVRETYLKNWKKLLEQQFSDEENEDSKMENYDQGGNSINSKKSGKTIGNVAEVDKTQKKTALGNSSRTQAKNTRPDKLISDNRSDEEKYAALSRHKILHSKSTSLDSQLNPSVNETTGSNHDVKIKKFGIMGIKSVGPSKSEANLVSNVPQTNNRASDQNEAHSDSETVVKSSRVHNNNEESQHKMVVRQCRIGTSIAFGLVGVTQSEPNGNGYLDGQGLVTIRMIPDEQGRFGFNVKGGADQGMPIIVSRVAPNTPADIAIPRLNEGDQVLFINGRDVSQHTHEQVVLYIRQSRETRSQELILIVRPNAYSADDNCDEPDLTYDPETHQISSATGGGNALDLSLKLLEESLESGAALAQFEQLYRKKPGMTMNAARLEINIPKNRYRDISPYDQTRVIVKNNPTGDYINANYVNMEIPLSGIVNRYIAAQGPLPTTCIDFWQMIWEQQSTLVVMLTTKVEGGRIKCHQYWPNLYETLDYDHLQITCVKEEETASFAFREFNLTNVELQEERHISHMQYISWPDHGVPTDPGDFLGFVIKVRQKRVGIVEPIIVHCSAGIGRTGVLITMETAMCLIEANQPVYPLSIVRQMRDQRAMLIQTPNQYKFVCEAIVRANNEGIVKPLADYSQR